MSFLGRRLADTVEGKFPLLYEDLRPGDIWKVLNEDGTDLVVMAHPSNLTKMAWFCIVPIEMPGQMADKRAFGNLRAHTVREHGDGTVSIRAGDGSSNSILITRQWLDVTYQWHGYVEHNIWTEV